MHRPLAHPVAQVFVCQVIQLAGMNARCDDDQGVSGNRIEVGAQMHRAFDCNNFHPPPIHLPFSLPKVAVSVKQLGY